MNVAIIPARGGSKRIPRKNIRQFAGKPIIAYSILAAAKTGLFDRIIVSTDDEEIAEVAKSFGAEIPFLRPKSLADDFTGTNAVVKHAIQWFMEQGEPVEYACCIYATAPFVEARYLQEGYEKLFTSDKAFAFSVTSFPFPVQRALRITQEGSIEPLYPEHIFSRSQDLEVAYHDAGQFYWGCAEAFLNDVTLYSPAAMPVVLPRYRVQDIDTLEDWQQAELMYTVLSSLDET
ncbi:MAG: pseudaminic acid cytidylyltransferase [Desulfobulbus sp.]|nr:pseudaminic acid cytidylyltransferase [Desulfobulbus sp.]